MHKLEKLGLPPRQKTSIGLLLRSEDEQLSMMVSREPWMPFYLPFRGGGARALLGEHVSWRETLVSVQMENLKEMKATLIACAVTSTAVLSEGR